MWSRLLVLFLVALSVAGLAEPRRLFILHTNDVHGHVEPYKRGGLVRVAAAVKLFREAFPGQVVLLDAGDTSLGTPLSGLSHGKPTAELFDLLDYDAVALGNHEFNWGKQAMRNLAEGFQTQVLCANLIDAEDGHHPYQPFTTLERNGVKLAIIGLVTDDTYRRAPTHATEGWVFLTPAQAVLSTLPTLPEDYDLLITLNHIGLKVDRKLAEQVPEIDLIVGGHSHTPLHRVEYSAETPIVQAGCYAEFLGVLELSVDSETGRSEVLGYRLLSFDENSPIDPQAMAVVEHYARELRPILDRKMAEVVTTLAKLPEDGGWDTALGNFISDVFRAQAGTDIALYNRGGVRFDMPAGALTVEDVHKLFPFDDPVFVLEATGLELREVIAQGTREGEGPLSASGLTAQVGSEQLEILVQGQALQDDKTYTLATTSFLANGGDGMSQLAKLKKLQKLDFTRDILLQYLESHERIDSPGVGRLRDSR